MTATPSVTVVIPTRDRLELVQQSVRSVLCQTRPVNQILIIDDGSESADATGLLTLPRMSPIIELVRNDRPRGPATARNVGLERAHSDHVLFLDDDDLIHPRLVEDGLTVLTHHPEVDVVVFQYECILTPESVEEGHSPLPLANLACRPIDSPRLADRGNPVPQAVLEQNPVSAFLRFLIPIHSCFSRRSAIGNTRFPETLTQGEDTYFWIALAASGRRFGFDSRLYAYVRRHAGNLTRSRARYMWEIQGCYEKLLADGLLSSPEDAYLAHLKLLWFKLLTRRSGRRRHLAYVLRSPALFARELKFWAANACSRSFARWHRQPVADAD